MIARIHTLRKIKQYENERACYRAGKPVTAHTAFWASVKMKPVNNHKLPVNKHLEIH